MAQWTTTAPTEAGYYAYRYNASELPTVLRLELMESGELLARFLMMTQKAKVLPGEWWSEPLSLPWEQPADDLGAAAKIVCDYCARTGSVFVIEQWSRGTWDAGIDGYDGYLSQTPADAVRGLAARIKQVEGVTMSDRRNPLPLPWEQTDKFREAADLEASCPITAGGPPTSVAKQGSVVVGAYVELVGKGLPKDVRPTFYAGRVNSIDEIGLCFVQGHHMNGWYHPSMLQVIDMSEAVRRVFGEPNPDAV